MEEKKKERFELVEVPTQMGLAYKDNSDDSVITDSQLLVKIANEIEELKKGLVG
jgi:hypothetical protein